MVNILTVFMTVAIVAFARGIPLPEDDILRDSNIVRADPKIDYRLPSTTIPTAYKLTLTPRLNDKFDFDGVVEISITTTETNLDKIVLHAKDLTIQDITLKDDKGNPIILKNNKGETNLITDFLTITPNTVLVNKGNYVLKIKYVGTLIHDDFRGFYRSFYEDDYGRKVWLATTHFEPLGARRAFPCFDEPALKATFEIAIKHAKKLHAISNMPYVNTTPIDLTTSLTTFKTTPIMSTYLVAFVVSDFEFLSNNDGSFNIWARKNAIRHGAFSLENGPKALKALDDYTGIKYATHGFEKLDNIAIPHFSSGAMENWGLVTYRETGLLVEDGVTTTAGKENVATVMSHEFAHQWFGNLVGPEWWTYTWLNEGFAHYLQFIITNEFLPEWRLTELQVVKSLQGTAFKADALSTAHAMNWLPSTPAEISSKFDSISYNKAGSIIRMTYYVLGETNFKAALNSYLQTNSAKNSKKVANSAALFKEFKGKYTPPTGSKLDITAVLENWATTPGFPVINVIRNYDTGSVNITQARFLLKPNSTNKDTYYVPFNYAQKAKDFTDLTVKDWVTPTDKLVVYDAKLNKDLWVVFNKEHFGYYRVNYDEANWELLSKHLNTEAFEQIPKINRAQLVDDALNLARVGQLKYKVALDLIKFLKQEFDYIPWHPAFQGLGYLNQVLANSKIYGYFKNYVLDLTNELVKNVTLIEGEKDEHVRKYLRVDALNWACNLGSNYCRDNAVSQVSSWLSDSKAKLSPDTKNILLCGAVRKYDQAAWDKLLQKYLAKEESGILTALGCTSNTSILKGYLTKTLEENSTLNRDSVFTAVFSGSEEGINVALDFVLENADKIYAASGNKVDKLRTYVNGIGQRITNQAQLDKLSQSKNKHIIEVRSNAVDTAKETLEWLKVHEQELVDYFTPKVTTDKDDNGSAVTFTISSILLVVTFSISQLY